MEHTKLAVLGFLSDIEEWVGQGWYVAKVVPHPVMAAYGRAYYWRHVIESVRNRRNKRQRRR